MGSTGNHFFPSGRTPWYDMRKPKKTKATSRTPAKARQALPDSKKLLADLRALIGSTRTVVAQAVNVALVLLYWQVGNRTLRDVLGNKRAQYGEQILPTLSAKLVPEYGQGFSERNLARMVRFAEVFPDREVVAALSRQLGWSHFVEIIYLKTDLQRDFYAEMCRVERWSVRTLRAKIGGLLFERTALSRKPKELAKRELAKLRETDQLSPDMVFRDPYFLNFLGLADVYSENDLESAILREMEQFILELGAGFTFVARQKRMIIDGKDFYLDLLFYHRKLGRLVAIDLKLSAFQAADKGQMELYLRWLEKHEKEPREEMPIGLILCEDKGEEQVELLQLDKSGIRVASYQTEFPPKAVLRKKLKDAAELVRRNLANRASP
jgi:predicted nuclease of restriction endonuclease-like (RecB) superfamily